MDTYGGPSTSSHCNVPRRQSVHELGNGAAICTVGSYFLEGLFCFKFSSCFRQICFIFTSSCHVSQPWKVFQAFSTNKDVKLKTQMDRFYKLSEQMELRDMGKTLRVPPGVPVDEETMEARNLWSRTKQLLDSHAVSWRAYFTMKRKILVF